MFTKVSKVILMKTPMLKIPKKRTEIQENLQSVRAVLIQCCWAVQYRGGVQMASKDLQTNQGFKTLFSSILLLIIIFLKLKSKL